MFLAGSSSTCRSHLHGRAHAAADEHGRSEHPDDGANPATIANRGAQPACTHGYRVTADSGPDPNTRTTNPDPAPANRTARGHGAGTTQTRPTFG